MVGCCNELVTDDRWKLKLEAEVNWGWYPQWVSVDILPKKSTFNFSENSYSSLSYDRVTFKQKFYNAVG